MRKNFLFLISSLLLLVGESVFAQAHPLVCAPGAKSTPLTEDSICLDSACKKDLEQARATIRGLKSPDEKAMLEDLNYLKVALLLNADPSTTQYVEKFLESQLKFLRLSLGNIDLMLERIQAHKTEPARAAEMDRIRLALLKEEDKKLEKKIAQVTYPSQTSVALSAETAAKNQELFTGKLTALIEEQSFLKNEISLLEQMPKFVADAEATTQLAQKVKKETTEQIQSYEIMMKKQKDLNLADRKAWSLWNAFAVYKHTIDKIKKRPTFRDCGLSNLELFAINYYTEHGYRSINRTLHGKNTGPYSLSWIELIKQAFPKLKNHEGIVVRGGKLTSDQVQQYTQGKELVFPAFMSTSLVKGFEAQYSFTIRSKTGKYIAPISSSPTEEEVLFLPGTKFKVVEVQEKKYSLEESL